MNKLLTFFVILFLTGGVAVAQEGNWAVGPHLMFSLPQGDFDEVSQHGEGIGGKLLYKMGESLPFLNWRLDLSYLSYGEKRNSGLSVYDIITTRNESFQLTLGPQVSRRIGRFTAYMAALGGIYNYRTVASLDSYYYSYYSYPYTETTESVTKLGWNVNGGFLLDIGLGPHIDVNVKYQTIPGAVKSTFDGNTTESDAEDLAISVGVVFFLNN